MSDVPPSEGPSGVDPTVPFEPATPDEGTGVEPGAGGAGSPPEGGPPEGGPPEEGGPEGDSRRVWRIVFAVVVILLLLAILLVLLLGGDDDESPATTTTEATTTTTSSTTTTTTSTSTTTTTTSTTVAPTPSPACNSEALLDGTGGSIDGNPIAVVEFACTPSGDPAGAYAWARVEATEEALDPLDVFFEADGEEWQVLDFGTDLVCDEIIPAAACDSLPGAPR